MKSNFNFDIEIHKTKNCNSILKKYFLPSFEEKEINELIILIKNTKTTFKTLFIAISIFKKSKYFLLNRSNTEIHKSKFLVRKIDFNEILYDELLFMVVALILASKLFDDTIITNCFWAKMCDYEEDFLKNTEIYVVGLLKWDLLPVKREYKNILNDFVTKTDFYFLSGNEKQRSKWWFIELLCCLGMD